MSRLRSVSPLIFESGAHGERAYDVFSKLMTQRVIFLGEGIDDDVANIICAQLNFLDDGTDQPINLYINSPGGLVTGLFAIYDTMQYINTPVHTLCIGQACSAAAVLLLAGAPGHRRSLPNSTIMLHQPSAGTIGKVTDIERSADHFKSNKKLINKIVAKHTGMSDKDVSDLMEWDSYYTATDAKKRGIIDEIITKRPRNR